MTVALSGTATSTTTTDASGNFAFTSLANGSYTLTPSKAGYTFNPASLAVSLSGANLTGENFAATAVATTHSLSGTVSGPYVVGVSVALSGAGTGSVLTDATGAYTFPSLAPGSYVVTPSLPGYTFTPGNATVAISTASGTASFTEAPSVASFTISGSVAYAGTATGPIYLGVIPQACMTCTPQLGTSIPNPGTFDIRGVPSGTWVVKAYRDAIGQGSQNATFPAGQSGPVTTSAPTVSAGAITLTDPAPTSPTTPAGLSVNPGAGGALLFWPAVTVGGVEAVTGYRVYWGTDVNASNGTPADVVASGQPHYVAALANGTYYFKVASKVGATVGTASTVVGPFTVPPGAGASTVSGNVTIPVAATGPLVVAIGTSPGKPFYVQRIAAPASPQPYSISGVPAGTYEVNVILDQNNDGAADAGDLVNFRSAPQVTVNGTASVTQDVKLSAASGAPVVTTQHGLNGATDTYGIAISVSDGVKIVTSAALVSATEPATANIAVPTDLARSGGFFYGASATGPAAGDPYRLALTYADGTSETLDVKVSRVLGVAQALTVTGANPNIPTFNWSAPASPPPVGYGYQLGLQGPPATSWSYPSSPFTMPSTQLSVVYNTDGTASSPSLTTGTTYTWSVDVVDVDGNSSTTSSTYKP